MALVALLANQVAAQDDLKTRKEHLNLKSELAIQGYDPVSYFEGDEAKEGKKSITHDYKGATYRFSSEANKSKFIADPTKFEPEYGGWCAYAMGETGEKVKVDPETYKIVNGKLYLFYNFFFNNTLDDWNEDESNLKTKADTNWSNTIKSSN